MQIEQHPVPNHWAGRGGERVRAICLHVSEGARDSVLNWFANPASDASSHYLVNKDGSVWQFVREDDTAWANGAVNTPDRTIGWLDDCLRRDQNPNRLTISIETERRWWEPLTDAQYAALVALVRVVLDRHGLVAGRETIIPHAAIDSVNRAHCPGNLDLARLLSDLTPPQDLTFPATGQTLRGAFLAFWQANGGLPIFGYPITGEYQADGRTIQYFERARFELHENGTVLLGLVGAELLRAGGAA